MNANILSLKKAILERMSTTRRTKLDFCVEANYLAFDVIADFAFGKPFGFVTTQKDPTNLIHTIDTRGEVLNALGHVPSRFRPWMRHLFLDSFWSRGLKATSNLEHLGRLAFQQRQKIQDSSPDLMSLLFSAKDPKNGGPLSGDEIIAEAISFIVGGSDTTSSTMSNFVDLVSREPNVQRLLQDELDGAFLGVMDPDWIASDAICGSLPFLNATLKEVMRFRPTSSTGLERVVPAGGREIADRFIPTGTLVSVPTISIMHDPSVFENPEAFVPHRWLGENAAILNENFHPFSLGPRSCIGRNFAWMEMVKTLGTMFKLFNFTPSNTSPAQLREGFFLKAAECWVTMETRH